MRSASNDLSAERDTDLKIYEQNDNCIERSFFQPCKSNEQDLSSSFIDGLAESKFSSENCISTKENTINQSTSRIRLQSSSQFTETPTFRYRQHLNQDISPIIQKSSVFYVRSNVLNLVKGQNIDLKKMKIKVSLDKRERSFSRSCSNRKLKLSLTSKQLGQNAYSQRNNENNSLASNNIVPTNPKTTLAPIPTPSQMPVKKKGLKVSPAKKKIKLSCLRK